MKGLKNMKRILPIVMQACMAVCCLTACIAENDMPGGTGLTDGNRILVDLSSGSLPLTRATSLEAAGAEIALDHVDVLIFDTDEKMVRHERVQAGSTAKESILKLSARREDFAPGTKYWVYLVANSTKAETEFEKLTNLTDLKALTETTRNIHVTGLPGTDVSNAPQTFLMDGIAYPASEQAEPQTAEPVVLNDADSQEDTELKVTLRRAAAKMVVVINKGDNVTFDDSEQASGAGYYLMNMPYTTSLIAGVNADAALRTPAKNSASYFNWTPEVITVTAYAYAHQWADGSLLEKQTRLVVNIPLTYRENPSDPDDEGTFYENNFYQIPVSEQKVLERNHCYTVTVSVNTVGGSDPSEPVELNDISYSVEEWIDQIINIGGEDDRPAYLTLNEYEMEMHNMEDDNTTLHFVSSSEVTAEITKVYYIDKFGQEQELELNPENNMWGVKTTSGGFRPTTTWSNECTIRITPDDNITGKIDVFGDIPENNAVRYIEFTVTNKDGVSREVTVAQYPLEYITNVVGWYSTRSDFGGTTYESPGNNRYVSAESYNNRYGNWDYDTSAGGFFSAKYVDRNSNGTSTIYYYKWSYNYYNGYYVENDGSTTNSNSRMYHVQITASSGTYTLGKPRITTEGITDPGSDNAKLVSPSFMIASQLGAVVAGNLSSTYENGIDMAASHCKEYVEVAKDGTVYDDWRLPTKAEVEIIAKFQRVEGSAVDVVLGGHNYYSASEIVNLGQGNDGTFLRCIRDAYDDKTTNN